jgi:SAM-dependent methyltransferase
MDKPDILKPIAGSVVRPLHDGIVSGRRVNVLSTLIAQMLPADVTSALDVGCGDGAICRHIEQLRPEVKFSGVDVLVRPDALVPVTQFDGKVLPFPEQSFDFSLLVDVLHHTEHQNQLLAECLRVSKRFVIIKDHLCETAFDDIRLRFMDWVGNKAHGVNLPYLYLSGNDWRNLYEDCGAEEAQSIDKLGLYPLPATWLFDGSLHFISKVVKRA